MSETSTKRFCILCETRSGRTWYHSTVPNTVTRRVVNMWTTSDRDEAIVLASQVKGIVVPVVT